MAYFYTAFGLTFGSDLEFDELLEIEPCDPDIHIRIGVCPENIDPITGSTLVLQVNDDEILMRIKTLGNFYAMGDKEVIIEPLTENDLRSMRAMFLSGFLGTILARRGLVPLHASAILVDEKAVIFSGRSGSGKSTLAARFQSEGFPILNDDICAIDLSGDVPLLQPGFPQIKLWKDALVEFGMDEAEDLRKLVLKTNKFAKPIYENFHKKAVPISHIFFLISKRNHVNITIEPIKGILKLSAIKDNLALSRSQHHITTSPEWFKKVSCVANSAEFFTLTRDPFEKDRDGSYLSVRKIIKA